MTGPHSLSEAVGSLSELRESKGPDPRSDPAAWAPVVLGARWFAGDPASARLVDVAPLPPLGRPGTPGASVRPAIATVVDATGTRAAYQLLVVDAADGPRDVADAPGSLPVVAAALEAGADATADGWSLTASLDPDASSPTASGEPLVLLHGEQSNTTLLLGPLVAKVVRLPDRFAAPEADDPSTTPDPEDPASDRLEHDRLAALAGTPGVPRLRGTLTARAARGAVDLVLVTDRVREGRDGWELAVRRAGTRGDTRFVRSLARRLAEVHAALADVGKTRTEPGAGVAARLTARIEQHVAEAPVLHPWRERLLAAVATVAVDDVPVQPVHGDLHLGQTLLTPGGWFLLDFGGEPLATPAERTRPDSPWRDVAGLLRSLDYAVASAPGADEPAAREWLESAREQVISGYAEGRGCSMTDADHRALSALEVDRCAYEVVYESRHRPAWVEIPLRAVARLLEE